MRIALAQMRMDEDREANIERALELMEQAAESGADLILYPELTFVRFFPQYDGDRRAFEVAEPIPGPMVERIASRAAALGIAAVPNIFERDGDRHYDTSFVIDRTGRLAAKARMMHVAEMDGFHEQFYYTCGDTGPVVADLEFARVGLAICYDRHYPEHLRALTLAGAQIVLVPNAAVEGEPLDMFEIEMRNAAFQQQLYVALVNRVGREGSQEFVGRSLVVDPHGTVIARGGHGRETLVLADVDLTVVDRARTVRPYLRDRRHGLYDL
jgi:N-carbamoylputrescine amidase